MTLTEIIFPAPVFPATLQGRPLAKIGPDIEIRDRDTLAYWYYKKYIRRFIFAPESAGLVGIDLDHKNGRDGIREFTDLTGEDPRNGFYTATPSGGVHVYFRNPDSADFVSCELRDHSGIEIKHRAFLTVPGSRSDRGIYTPHGDPGTIRELPAELRDVMPTRNPAPAPMPRHSGESLALHRILDILRCQGLAPVQGQRNYFAFQFSRYARKQGHGPGEVMAFLTPLASGDFSSYEIRSAVNSAFRGAR